MGTLADIERATIQWLVQHYQRRTLHRAVRQSYANFARRYPSWAASLFDEYFVNTHLLPLLQNAAETGDKLSARQIADQWARQLSLLPAQRQKYHTAILPVATHFLCLLADELAAAQVGGKTLMLVETAVG